MEQNALATEDSVDSIPGPAYERIVGATPILTYGAKVDNRHANSVILAVEEGAEMEDEEGSDIDGEDDDDDDMDTEEPDDEQRIGQAEEESIMEHDYRGRDDYKENESNLVQKELDALEGAAVAAAAATEQINDNISSSTTTSAVTTIVEPVSKPVLETIVTDKATTMRIESSSADAGDCPIPVQIVSALTVPPKLLSMQSKNNKVIMVQMLNEQAVDGKNASVKSALTDPLANDPIATETEVSDSAGKTHSPNQDKSPNLSQQQQNQQHSLRFLARSSTPLSREFLALQRSVNESKVLSEFVTDAVRKRQKSAPKDANEPATSQHHHHHHHYHAHGEKPRKPGKFAPLKDDNASSTSSTIPRRSRSKSVNRKSIDGLDAAGGGKLKRWPSDEKLLKRTNMRSQNSEFVQKQIEFLNRVKHDEGEVSSEAEDGERSLVNGGDEEEMHLPMEHNTMNDSNVSAPGLVGSTSSLLEASLEVGGKNCMPVNVDSIEARLMAYWAPPPKRGWDSFCWKCRECVDLFPCSKCVRGFHCTCIKVTASTKLDDSWVCPECVSVENVLNGPKRSSRRGEVSLDLLSQLLSFALKRMKMVKGYPKFLYSDEDLLHYSKYIVNPVTFTTLQEKVEKRAFRCSEEFLNETKWILHNALILNSGCGSEYPSETDFTKSHTLQLPTSLSASSKEVFTAKSILKVCRQEANEIDTCGECYLNANTRPDWFVDVCSQPHLLLWAKLKGFPYWPAKAMGPGQGLSHVNVRFFGEHDRAFVPVKDCFLYSEQDPNTQTGKRSARELADCIKEVELHIEKIKVKVGAFKYAKIKTPYEPAEELQQLEMMMPGVTDYMKRQQSLVPKPSLQYKIVKTADNHLSIIKKASATESGNDSDHSGSPNKKSSCSVSSGSGNGLGASVGDIKTSQIAPKYEVVSKASSDDSSSSKVTAVILKRKPSSEHKKEASEDLDLPMPKMIKFDEEEDEHKLLASGSTAKPTSGCAVNTGDNAVGKRKHGTDNSGGGANTSGGSAVEPERHRTKHAKNEPRVPLLTIKTNANGNTLTVATDGDTKPVATNPNTNATSTLNAEVKTATVCVKEEVAAVAKAIALTPPTNNAQTVMENLVKNKHGVTIKKISKEVAKKASTESTKLTVSANATPDETQAVTQLVGKKDALAATAVVSETQLQSTAASHTSDSKSASGSKTENGSGSDKPKTEENKKGAAKSAADTHILKDLVPFVEIKREFTSDDEADSQTPANVGRQDKKQTSAKVPANEKTGAATSTAVPAAQTSCATAAQVPLPAVTTPNLSLVKQEVMSDDEETSTKINVASNVVCTASTQPALGSVAAAGEKAIDMQPTSAAPNPLPDAVRVGDTMIQRVNAKNVRNTQATLVTLKSPAQVAQEAAAAMDAATAVAAAMHASPPNRRLNARGVPYGPLPASVVAQPPQQSQKSVVVASNATNRASLQQQQQPPQQQQLPQSQSPAQLQVQVQAQTQPQPQPQPLQLPPQQRARKSFPNRGTTDISPARSNFPAAPLPSPGLPPPSTSPLATSNDLKRTLLKNSMVSIPRQAWSPHEVQRNAAVGTSSSNTSNHSIPVPPLTAVSKTPAVGAVLGDNNNAANANNNNSSNSNANATINSTPIATPFISCNGGGMGSSGPALLTPLTMSAPPPLAGLSSSLSSPSTNLLAPTAIASVTGNLPIVVNSSSNVGGSISISSAVELPTQQTVSAAASASGVPSTSNGDFVTPSLAAMVTDAICRGPPKMVQRPNGPLQSDGANMFPSQAGPVCQTLVENAHKLTDFFISVMEDTMLEMSVGEEPVLQAKITLLKMELERTKQAYEQEIAELKRTSDLMLCEMRKSMENEKTRIANEIRKQCEQERLRSIEETKKKQWCSNCGREAQFYCCWNTSYCDYPCQQMHWSRHSATCAQTRPTNANVCDSLAKTASSTMTTTVSAVGQQQQQQQQQLLGVGGGGSKASSSNIMTVTTTTSMAHQQASHYNKTMSNKKDKHGASKMSHQQSVANAVSSGGNVGSNSMATIAAANASGMSVPAGAATELLKLPSNTYLRTVPQCGNAGTNNSSGGNLRGSTYSVQRVNIPLPITALVQRGNSWELTSAAPTNNAGATNMATITAPPSNVTPATMTQLTPQQQQQQQQQQRMMSSVASSGGVSSTMTMSRGNSRSRAAAAAQAMQQTMATMHNASSGGGGSGAAASSMSCGVLRPTQM